MLRWKTRPRKEGELYVVLEGDLTEGESLRDLRIEADRVVLNLARVRYVNSEGSRRLIQFLDGLHKTEITIELCSPAIVNLINMVPILATLVHIESVIVPLECPDCENETDMRVHLPASGRPDLDYPRCEECGSITELAVLPERYFAWIDAAE